MIIPITDIKINKSAKNCVEGLCQLNKGAYIKYEVRRIKQKEKCLYFFTLGEEIQDTFKVFNLKVDHEMIINHIEKEFFKHITKERTIRKGEPSIVSAKF